jgi:hypothetical protein
MPKWDAPISTWMHEQFKTPLLEPVLFEVENDRVLNAYRHIGLNVALLKLVGLKKSIEILSIVGKANQEEKVTKVDTQKRSLLKYAFMGLGASLALPLLTKIQLDSVIAATLREKLVLGNRADKAFLIRKARSDVKYNRLKRSLLSEGYRLQREDYVIALIRGSSKVLRSWAQVFKKGEKTRILTFTVTGRQSITQVISVANNKIIGISRLDSQNHLVYDEISDSKSVEPKFDPLGCAVCTVMVTSCRLWCAVPALAIASCIILCGYFGGGVATPACIRICNGVTQLSCEVCNIGGGTPFCAFFCAPPPTV